MLFFFFLYFIIIFAVSRDHPLAVIQAIDPVIRASGVANHMAISVLLHARGQIPIDFGPVITHTACSF